MAEFRQALRRRLDQLTAADLGQIAREAWFGGSHDPSCQSFIFLLYTCTTSETTEDIMGVALRDVKLADRHVELSWADGRAGDQFSLLWLKDHCPSPQCLHPETRQRQVDTFSIPENVAARAVAVE